MSLQAGPASTSTLTTLSLEQSEYTHCMPHDAVCQQGKQSEDPPPLLAQPPRLRAPDSPLWPSSRGNCSKPCPGWSGLGRHRALSPKLLRKHRLACSFSPRHQLTDLSSAGHSPPSLPSLFSSPRDRVTLRRGMWGTGKNTEIPVRRKQSGS